MSSRGSTSSHNHHQHQQQQQPCWENSSVMHNHNINGEAVRSRAAVRGRGARWAIQQQTPGAAPPAPTPGGGVPKAQRICGVCGDRARSLHFGGLSCDSCKAFFRRAVQSGAFKNFVCPHQSLDWQHFCVINVASRKSCQKCRFERCVKIGMEVSWVMSEAERQRLLSARLAKRRKLESETDHATSSSPPHQPLPLQDYLWPLKPDNVCLEKFMTSNEVGSVLEVKSAWVGALQHLPPTPLEGMDLNQSVDHALLIRSMAGSIQRFTMFAQPLLESAEMLDDDKKALLQGSMLEMCILRGALNHVRGKVLYKRYFPARLHDIHCRFVKSLQELALDQTTLLLFLMVILMSPERPALSQPQTIEKLQDYYLMLLNKYLNGRYGNAKAAGLYPKLLSKMTDLRELSDCHQEQNLMFAQHELKTMKQELHRIQQPDNTFQPPQKCCEEKFQQPINEFQGTPQKCTMEELTLASPQIITEPTMPNSFSQPRGYSSSPPSTTSSSLSSPQYTPTHSVSSPCDSTTQRFFPQTLPFTETNCSDDLYLQMTSVDDKEHDQFFSPYVCLPVPDLDTVRSNDNIGTRPQDFQPCCFSVQQRAVAHNGVSRYQLYDPNMYLSETFSLEKEVPSLEECQALVQQCLQEGQGTGTLLLPANSSGHAESYDFSTDFALHDASEALLISAYHR